MASFWRRLFGLEREEAGAGRPVSGADYVGMAELMRFNRNLVEAQKHEKSGIELYTRFLEEANDERGRAMYRKLIEEERRHLRMVEEEIEEHKRQGYWS
jgi:rubrerythrin